MKQIKKGELKQLNKTYKNNNVNLIARNALNRVSISDLVKNNTQSSSTQNNFSINLDTLKVTNQMQSGRCWIFAGLNILREYTAKKYKLDDFELSQNFVSFYDKLEKCNYFLELMISLKDKPLDDRLLLHFLTNPIDDGGQWNMFVNIIKKYGIVPKSVYPETYQSENTTQINVYLNRYLRKTTMLIRNSSNKKEIDRIKEQAVKDIYFILCDAFGVPPTEFTFDFTNKKKKYHYGDLTTPKKFFNEYIGINLNNFVSIINSPTKDKPFNKAYEDIYLNNVAEGSKVRYLNLEMSRIKELSIKQLQDGHPVWFGSDCVKYGYFDKKGGLWDDKSYNEDLLFQVDTFLSKDEMLDYRESSMDHAMVLTGVNLVNGKPTKWKVQNSWGDTVGNKGYYVATNSWFDRFVYQVVIDKKYLTEKELKAYEEQPIYLEPWDPMGSLAKNCLN